MISVTRRLTYTLVLAGAVAGMAGGAVIAGNGTGAANAGAAQTTSGAAHAGTMQVAARGTRGGAGVLGTIKGMAQRAGRLLKVTAVNGNTIQATDRAGTQITVDVGGSTTYSRAGASSSLSAIQVGDEIAVRGQVNNSTHTITATAITIVLPSVTGVVTAVNGNTLTLTDLNAITRTVTVNGSTQYTRAGTSDSQSDVAVGTLIGVQGTQNSDGSLTAVSVEIHVPRLAGTVSGLASGQFTLTTADGTTYTVTTSSSTTYAQPGYGTATAAALKNSGNVQVEGTLSGDGKTLSALRITILPSFSGRGAAQNGAGQPASPGTTSGTGTNA